MYEVKETEYGLYLRIIGEVSLDESKAILSEVRVIFERRETGICAFADLQKMELLSLETQAVCVEIQKMLIELGVKRVVTMLGNATVAHQFKRLSLQSGLFDFDRYIDVSINPDWEEIGLRWMNDGIDPDADRREMIARRRAALTDSSGD